MTDRGLRSTLPGALNTDDRQRSSPESDFDSCARSAGEPGGRQPGQEAVGDDCGAVVTVKDPPVPFAYVCPDCKNGFRKPTRCGGPHPRVGLKRLYYDFVDAVPVYIEEQLR